MSDSGDQTTVKSYVTDKVKEIYEQKEEHGSSLAIAQLAQLRRGAGNDPANNPGLWEIVFGKSKKTPNFPEHYKGKGDALSYEEQATYAAVTLFALHQQSRSQLMHVPNFRFGTAVGQLVLQTSESMKKRFDALLKARSESARRHYLRSLITLLRSEEIAFDYGQFAQDYMQLQNPEKRDAVILRWSREFLYGYEPKKSKTSEETSKN
ncbi:hypothetical protein HMPREF3016_10490 [Rothia sp. HMSC065D02]|uniref:type I-E CRISPR-associated protein Cse2/CasB n=1 Tax=Rothia sp. HMSC065D02 TaxID=1739518 RepID=UPI0008A1FADF|nr:type I-E CRISPR-associated protein Cse2/CasB [Rothia sp. HMSC065D02]OFO77087.1 hypothetical protein HMPREF3016_10490 [Rothia sp. HMSC065D02]